MIQSLKQSNLCFLCFLQLSLFGQVNPGPRITAMGMAGVALQDVWSIQSNQAGLITTPALTISAAYENEFLSPDLSKQSLLVVYPHKRNIFGISFQNYGFSAYNEQRAGIAYARSFGNISAALNFNYHLIQIHQYGSTQTYSIEAGLEYALNDKFLIGTHIANPNRSTYGGRVSASIPVTLEFGFSYKMSDNLLLCNEIIKTLNSPADIKAGIEYSLARWFDLRGGLSVNPFCQYMGIGCRYQNLRLDAAAASHYALGYSPQVALSYEF